MRQFNGKAKLATLLLGIVLLAVFIVRFISVTVSNQQLKSDFKPLSSGSDYLNEVDIEEIDFQSLDALTIINEAPLAIELTTEFRAPRTINYYDSPQDNATPVFTINKGTTIDLVNDPLLSASDLGYGIHTYPTYTEGWRYGKPFKTSGETRDEMFYVKLDDIEAVTAVYYDENKYFSASYTKQDIIKRLTLESDEQFYKAGAYLSPDYYAKRLLLIDWIVLAATIIALAAFIFLHFRRNRIKL